jgi:hypothetical protein
MEYALRKRKRSVLEYSETSQHDPPDKVFTSDYLKRL